MVADEDIDQAQVFRIGIGVIDVGGDYEDIAGMDGVVDATDEMGAMAVEDDNQFDKVVLVQSPVGLIGFAACGDALVGHFKPGLKQFIAACEFEIFATGIVSTQNVYQNGSF